MSEHEDEVYQFFEDNEKVLISLSNGDHILGELISETDAGICVKILSRTVLSSVESKEHIGYEKKFVELNLSIRAIVPWRRIDLVESANEFYENEQLEMLKKGMADWEKNGSSTE